MLKVSRLDEDLKLITDEQEESMRIFNKCSTLRAKAMESSYSGLSQPFVDLMTPIL